MKPYKVFSPTIIICTNCSQQGHLSKQCPHPITSYGVILFRIKGGWNQAVALLQDNTTGMESIHDRLEYLLIQRRDSIGFIEIMRGKYRITDTEYIKIHINGMTDEEKHNLLTISFDELWEKLWGIPSDSSHAYRHEKDQAKQKLEALHPSLEKLISECDSSWKTPEWGFPKGRRDIGESEYTCAIRELWEETNVFEKDIVPVRNMEPIQEVFNGTNNIKYCHKYYIAYAPEGVGEESLEDASKKNIHIKREISSIQWLSFADAIEHIRPDNVEKRQVLFRVHKLFQQFCPLAFFTPPVKKSL